MAKTLMITGVIVLCGAGVVFAQEMSSARPVVSIPCYECQSVNNPNCADPFNATGISNCSKSDACWKVVSAAVNGVSLIIRGCDDRPIAKDGCTKDTQNNNLICKCKEALCNDGTSLTQELAITTLLLSLILSALFVKEL